MTVPVETFAPSSTAAGGGALGALVGLSNFVYSIIKDHGHQCKFTSKDGGPGVSTVPKDMPVRIESRHELGGVWYTHTRAWASAAKSLYSHTKTDDPKKFTSSYLCVVFPFKVTYAVAVPDVERLDLEITTLKREIAQGRLEAKQTLRKQLEEELTKLGKEPGAPTAPTAPIEPPVPVAPDNFRQPSARVGDKVPPATREELEHDQALLDYPGLKDTYDKAKTKYDEDKKAYDLLKAKYDEDKDAWDKRKIDYDIVKQLVEDLADAARQQLDAKTVLQGRKQTLRDKAHNQRDVKYMTNVHLSGADGWNGLKSKGWQNVKVDASFTLRADEVGEGASPTVSIDMAWAETAIGYGKAWTGTIVVSPNSDTVGGSGKFTTRFNQLATLVNL